MSTYKHELKSGLKEYPDIFPTEGEFLHHLFFVGGNGYEWDNGQLVCKVRESKKERDYRNKYLKDMLLNLEKIVGRKIQRLPPTIHTKIYPLDDGSSISTIPENVKKDWLEACEKAIQYASTLKRTKSDIKWLEKSLKRVEELKLK